MSTLAELLMAQREEIVQRWTEQVRQDLAPGPRSEAELRDHIPDYLDRLAAALRRPSPSSTTTAEAAEVAQQHGRQRFRVGFSLEAVVREYAVLRGLIVKLVKEHDVPVPLAEVLTLADFIADAVAEGVAEHTRQREQAERTAKEQDTTLRTFRALIEGSSDFIAVGGTDGRLEYVNPAGRRLVGLESLEAARQLSGADILTPETSAELMTAIMPAVVAGEYFHGESVFQNLTTGEEIPMLQDIFAIRGADGEVLAVATISRDLRGTKRIEAERARFLFEAHAARAEGEAERQKLHDIFQQAPVGIAIIEGPQHTFTFANPAYEALVSEWGIVGKPLLVALPALEGQGFDVLLDDVVATGKPFVGNEVPTKLHGEDEVSYFNFVYEPKRNARGEVDGVLVCASEVTNQVQALQRAEAEARARQAAEERLRRVMEVAQVGSWELDIATGVLTADARFREMFGLTPDEPCDLAKGLGIIHDEDRARVAQAIEEALAGKNAGHYEAQYRTTRVDGVSGWVFAWGQAEFDREGKAVRLLGMGIDITARKEAELAREGLLEALAQQPSLQVSVLEGPKLFFTMANILFLEEVARGRPVIGRPMMEVFPELKRQGFEELLQSVIETGQPFLGREVRVELDRGDGTLHEAFYNLVYQPVRGPSGHFESILSLSHEITDIVRAREQAARLAAEEKERAAFEQQLIGIVSHDLRNPLGAILLGASILRGRKDLDERSMKIVKRIYSSVERATALVKDVLDFTQARLGGGLPVRHAPMDAHAIVRQIADELQVNYPERSIWVALEGDGKGDWDAERVGQVLTNLASNALKYGKPVTPVTMRARNDGDAVVLEVHNEGTPIPAEAMERIFQPLQRGTAQADRLGRSVGLGLYIVKHIVEAHGGSIGVTSSAEAGTTFSVRLPHRPAPSALAPAS